MPKLCEVIGEPKQRFIIKELYVRDTPLQLRSVNLGLSKAGNQAKQLKYSGWRGGRCILYQFREDAQTHGHQPQYMADNEAVKTDVCAVHMSTLSHTSSGMLRESIVSKDEIRTSLIKSTSTCSTSPGLNSPTFTWRKVQHMAEAGKQRGFIMSVF